MIVVVNSYTNITEAIMGGCGDVTLLFEGILYGDKTNSMGLHLVMQLANNVAYTNSFDMNNLIVEI